MWNKTELKLPKNDTIVLTKIEDERGARNEQHLLYRDRLWWTTDGKMYVYYVPTHWREIE